MSEPLISVVVTTYNRARLVCRAIESVRAQTYTSIEIIVVDDASEDDTISLVSAIPDPRLRLIRNEKNRGPGAAKNAGVRAARGEFVAFLDSDDEWLPRKLEVQLDAMRSSPLGEQVSVTTCWIIRRNGRRILRRYARYPDSLTAIASGEMYNFGSTSMIRRRCFEQIGPIREDISRLEDLEWMLRYSLSNTVIVIDEPLSIVVNTGWPSRQTVVECTRAFAAAASTYLSSQPRTIRSLVAGSLLFENAIAAWRDGSPGGALQYLVRLVRSTPSYLPVLARRMQRKLRRT